MDEETTRAIQEHILLKIEEALGDRSWRWLAITTGIAQATLQAQKGTTNRPIPRFSLEALMKIAAALEKPADWFLPAVDIHLKDDDQED